MSQSTKMIAVCSICGGDEIYAIGIDDRWCIDAQKWGSVNDEPTSMTCNKCGDTSHELVPAIEDDARAEIIRLNRLVDHLTDKSRIYSISLGNIRDMWAEIHEQGDNVYREAQDAFDNAKELEANFRA